MELKPYAISCSQKMSAYELHFYGAASEFIREPLKASCRKRRELAPEQTRSADYKKNSAPSLSLPTHGGATEEHPANDESACSGLRAVPPLLQRRNVQAGESSQALLTRRLALTAQLSRETCAFLYCESDSVG